MEEFLDRVLTKAEGVLDQPESEGSHLVFNPANGRLGMVNLVGFNVWTLLDGRRTLAEVVHMLEEKYRRPTAELTADVKEFIGQLEERELVYSKKRGMT